MVQPGPNFELENRFMGAREAIIIGIDEAGRGPWAGPVVAAAVHLDRAAVPDGLNDSKLLKAPQREQLYRQILEVAAVGVGEASVEEIDTLNILQASLLAMQRAVLALSAVVTPERALVDGNAAPALSIPVQTVVKGDARSVSIAAASIVAKVHRDRLMTELHETYPRYDWRRNKGYGTRDHQSALAAYGPCLHHRRSFKPIQALTAAGQFEKPLVNH